MGLEKCDHWYWCILHSKLQHASHQGKCATGGISKGVRSKRSACVGMASGPSKDSSIKLPYSGMQAAPAAITACMELLHFLKKAYIARVLTTML